MNFYMLVEGKSTEMKVYPKWIAHFCPQYKLVKDIEEITEDSYYMFSGNGMPGLYHEIAPALSDISIFNQNHECKIEQFVVCLDTDYYGSEDETYYRVSQEIMKNQVDDVEFSIILQTMCIETWFLGNREEFPPKYSKKFEGFVNHYNVSLLDPEEMREPEDEGSIGKYSKKYLKRMLTENGKTYSVSKVDSVSTKEYINGVEERFKKTSHIKSYKYFKDFIKGIS